MPSTAYYEWLDAGQPYTLAVPVVQFVNLLRNSGYLVYHKGDESHMQADPPEDHTPFSATGWPIPSRRWVGHALDILPSSGPLALPDLARRIIRDRDNHVYGTRWIKYLNWTDEAGKCSHESWANVSETRVTTSSTDKGHIHISARSDADASSEITISGWNPLEDNAMLRPAEEYKLHVINERLADLVAGKTIIDVPPFLASDGNTFPALTSTNQVAVDVRAIKDAIRPDALANALVQVLSTHPEVIDAIATAVASRIGMIPTATEIAKAIGALDWHGSVTG